MADDYHRIVSVKITLPGPKGIPPKVLGIQNLSSISFRGSKKPYARERDRSCGFTYRLLREFTFNGSNGVLCAEDIKGQLELINYRLLYNDGGSTLLISYNSVLKAEFPPERIPDVLATMRRQ